MAQFLRVILTVIFTCVLKGDDNTEVYSTKKFFQARSFKIGLVFSVIVLIVVLIIVFSIVGAMVGELKTRHDKREREREREREV